MGMLGEVLAIRVALSGMDVITSGLRSFVGNVGSSAAEVQVLKGAMIGLAAATAVVAFAMRDAGQDETMRLNLEAITHSSGTALDQMHRIRSLSEEGIFKKDEIYAGVRALDLAKVPLQQNLELAEKLALRMGGDGKLGQAAKIIAGMAGGGMGRMTSALREAGLTVEELRAAGLNINARYQIKGTPQEALAALRKSLDGDTIGDKLGGGLEARLRGVLAIVTDVGRSLGESLLPLSFVLVPVGGILKAMVAINDMTHGWAGAFVMGGMLLNGMSKAWELAKGIGVAEKIATAWTGLRAAIYQDGIVGSLIKALGWLKANVVQEIVMSYYAAVAAAAMGNFLPIALWGAGAAVVAGGAAWGVNAAFGGGGDQKTTTPAERPIRRSDIERQHQRMRARSYA